MRRCDTETAISEGLLTALDDCLDAMLSGVPGMEEGQRVYPEPGTELEPLLAVAFELMRSRERIDQRLAARRGGGPQPGEEAGFEGSVRRATCYPYPGSSRRTWRRRSSTSRPTAPGT